MREVRRSALLPFTAGQIYGLVADVERYPEFLPRCTTARILSDEGEFVTVNLGLSRGMARGSFTTRNRLVPERSLTMSLVDGPFSLLEGRWEFTPIADAGSRADLHVRFATALSVVPAVNLVTNIGFGPGAVHTKEITWLADLPREAVSFPLCHPPDVVADARADALTEARVFSKGSRRIRRGLRARYRYLFGASNKRLE